MLGFVIAASPRLTPPLWRALMVPGDPVPSLKAEGSYALRELLGVLVFVMTARNLVAGGNHRVSMGNLGCVFITSCAVPPFAVGGERFT